MTAAAGPAPATVPFATHPAPDPSDPGQAAGRPDPWRLLWPLPVANVAIVAVNVTATPTVAASSAAALSATLTGLYLAYAGVQARRVWQLSRDR